MSNGSLSLGNQVLDVGQKLLLNLTSELLSGLDDLLGLLEESLNVGLDVIDDVLDGFLDSWEDGLVVSGSQSNLEHSLIQGRLGVLDQAASEGSAGSRNAGEEEDSCELHGE